ncbi:hypothetical protein DSUL_50125 [Desulfovibrionales bacterium]
MIDDVKISIKWTNIYCKHYLLFFSLTILLLVLIFKDVMGQDHHSVSITASLSLEG